MEPSETNDDPSPQARDTSLALEREESAILYLRKREKDMTTLLKSKLREERQLFEGIKITELEKRRLEENEAILEALENRKKAPRRFKSYKVPEEGGVIQETEDIIPDTTNEHETRSVSVDASEMIFSKQEPLLPIAASIASSQQFPANIEQNLRPNFMDRSSLPIARYENEIIEAINRYQVLILVGETGSGKTTQIPQYLAAAGYSNGGMRIGCTQPRRVAAMSVAARVAEEMGVCLGREVGYTIRFEDCSSDETYIKYMTDGMLLREVVSQPDLKNYSVLIIDEAHERTLHTDVLFGLIKDILKLRTDMKVVISSATLDADKFSDYFDGAPIFTVPGRRYPVDIYHTKEPQSDYLASVIKTIFQIHLTPLEGDILVFLTGQDEIEQIEDSLHEISRNLGQERRQLLVVPIYANLPTDLQTRIFLPAPRNTRKVVLATNIAETSITIDGISFVIDPGFVKQKSFNPRTGIESLVIGPCSQAAANQRAGRAGRVGPGKCFRLYTAWALEHEMEPNTVPEIQRTNLGSVILLLKNLGIDDLVNFDFIDSPPAELILRALEELYALGALDERGSLTKEGKLMAEFPLEPMMSKSILASRIYNCTSDVISVIAMLGIHGSIFYYPRKLKAQAERTVKSFANPYGDHCTLLNIWNSWTESGYSKSWCLDHFIQYRSLRRAKDLRDQLLKLTEKVIQISSESVSDSVALRKAFLSGFFFHTAYARGRREEYRTLKHGHNVHPHPSSVLGKERVKCLFYHELVLTSKEYMRQISEIDPKWLLEVAPHYFSPSTLAEISKR